MTPLDVINNSLADYGYHVAEDEGVFRLFRYPFSHPVLISENAAFVSRWIDDLLERLPCGHA